MKAVDGELPLAPGWPPGPVHPLLLPTSLLHPPLVAVMVYAPSLPESSSQGQAK